MVYFPYGEEYPEDILKLGKGNKELPKRVLLARMEGMGYEQEEIEEAISEMTVNELIDRRYDKRKGEVIVFR